MPADLKKTRPLADACFAFDDAHTALSPHRGVFEELRDGKHTAASLGVDEDKREKSDAFLQVLGGVARAALTFLDDDAHLQLAADSVLK
jgi:hypothetical protein